MIPLPFSKRTTASAAVFACIFIASPQGAQSLVPLGSSFIGPLQLEYAQLINLYPTLIHQDTANNNTDLNAAIDSAESIVNSLNTTMQTLPTTGPNGFAIKQMQIVVANALTALKNAQSDESLPE